MLAIEELEQSQHFAPDEIDAFLKDRGVPIVEGRTVTFVYRGDALAMCIDLAGAEASAKSFKDAGLDLIVFYLPPPHNPGVLEPLARIAERVG